MKFITNKFALLFLLMLFVNAVTQAQEIIKDSVVEPVKKVTSGKRLKIDGVIATVGDYIILDSDIDKSFLELSTNGNSVKDITRCQMLGKLLEDKLYAHQAIQDSIVVTDAEIKGVMEEKLDFIVSKIGSIDKVVEYYKKNSEEELKSYFFDILKEQKLSAEMQKKIVEEPEGMELNDLGYDANLHMLREINFLNLKIARSSDVAFFTNNGSIVIKNGKKTMKFALAGGFAFLFLTINI